MKRWVLYIEGKTHVCDFIRAWPDQMSLKLALYGKEFFVDFVERLDYLEANNGTRAVCKVWNIKRTKYRDGFAVYRIPKA